MKKTVIIYGERKNGVQKKAIAVLSELLSEFTVDYPACFSHEEKPEGEEYRYIYIGTKGNNPYIREKADNALTHKEGYSIRVENDSVWIEGYDDAGVLYGCMDFYNKYIVRQEYPGKKPFRMNPFEGELEDYCCLSFPAVQNRGIWTWGHVIYDYRDFIDNMVRLKINTVIVWNDFVPVNAAEMVEYAHDCGVKILWGFAWLWDTDCRKFSIGNLGGMAEEIFRTYEKEYAAVGGDGIYFQSFTELGTDTIDGMVIAEAVTAFVNETAELFYEKYPGMELQFGLHATSVRNKLEFIEKVNPKIRIVWENCGAFPFSYFPENVETFAETKDFVKKIAVLRGEEDKFGAVTKGFTQLDWSTFVHADGPMLVGNSGPYLKQNRIDRKKKIWRYLQAGWLANADKAYEMVREMAEVKKGDLYITALVEDGMFEENCMYPVALFSEMLWDNEKKLTDMMREVGLRSYVTFA